MLALKYVVAVLFGGGLLTLLECNATTIVTVPCQEGMMFGADRMVTTKDVPAGKRIVRQKVQFVPGRTDLAFAVAGAVDFRTNLLKTLIETKMKGFTEEDLGTFFSANSIVSARLQQPGTELNTNLLSDIEQVLTNQFLKFTAAKATNSIRSAETTLWEVAIVQCSTTNGPMVYGSTQIRLSTNGLSFVTTRRFRTFTHASQSTICVAGQRIDSDVQTIAETMERKLIGAITPRFATNLVQKVIQKAGESFETVSETFDILFINGSSPIVSSSP